MTTRSGTRRSTIGLVPALVLAASLPGAALGQTLAERVEAVRDGKVRMSYPADEGVCGNGRNVIRWNGGRTVMWGSGQSEDWETECDPGPVRLVLRVRGSMVRDIDTYVGGRWRPAGAATVDLGPVSAEEAARYLLSLARTLPNEAAEDAIMPALLADGVAVWPQLLELARADDVRSDVRESAVFWLGQAAGDAISGELGDMASDDGEDMEIRERAIFALSQRPHDEGVPALIRLARRDDLHPRLRKKALFWLAQSEDPRAIGLFEEILTGR